MNGSKNLLLIGVSILIVIGVSAALIMPKNGDLMIDSFEGAINKKTVDFGSADNSSLEVTAAKNESVCGHQSLKLKYTLNKGGYMWCAKGAGLDVLESAWQVDPAKIQWEKYDAIRFSMYGNKTGTVAFDLKDAGGELHRFMVKDDFAGWKEITIKFSDFIARADWQPQTADGNKTLDFPVKSFQWEPKTVGSGELYFDCMRLVNTKATQ